MNDPISDMLTRMRNALSRNHEKVEFPYSRMKQDVLKVLLEKGLILSFETINANKPGTKKNLVVSLKYVHGKPAITEIKRISKPGKRVYTSYKEIPVVRNKFGFMILSTSRGIKDTVSARKEKVGGEIMCEIF